jgi:hypothetical protein
LAWVFEGKEPTGLKLSKSGTDIAPDSGEITRQPDVIAYQNTGVNEDDEGGGEPNVAFIDQQEHGD